MLEIYDILYKDKIRVGVIQYNSTTKQLSAYRDVTVSICPLVLFGLKNTAIEVGDEQVRNYIRRKVAPLTRENIVDVLDYWGLTHYDEWDLFKVSGHVDRGDGFTIKFREILEGD